MPESVRENSMLCTCDTEQMAKLPPTSSVPQNLYSEVPVFLSCHECTKGDRIGCMHRTLLSGTLGLSMQYILCGSPPGGKDG